MKRNKFLLNGFKYGLSAAAMMPVFKYDPGALPITDDPDCDKKMKFVHGWVNRFMEVVDTKMNKEEGQKLMDQCGRSCFCSHQNSSEPVEKMEPEDLVKRLKTIWSEEAASNEGDIVFIKYILKNQPNKCLCPMVNRFSSEISGTYCLCSAGYLKQMFETYTDKMVEVEIRESIIRGGNVCSFRVKFINPWIEKYLPKN